MKKTIISLAALVAATLLSCSKHEITENRLIDVTLTVSETTSKAVISDAGAVTWAAEDKLSVFTDTDAEDGSTNYIFSVKEIAEGGKSAKFNGQVSSNNGRTTIYALHPSVADAASANSAAVSIPVEQICGKSGQYGIMSGAGTVSGNDFSSASVSMTSHCYIWDIDITNSEGKAVASVSLMADSEVFPVGGTLDLTATSPEIAVSSYTDRVSYRFAEPETSTTVKARFVMLPAAINGAKLTIIVTYKNGDYSSFVVEGFTSTTTAGQRYCNTIDLSRGSYSEVPEGFTLVNNTDEFRAALAGSAGELKIYLASSASGQIQYKLPTSSRYNLTKSLTISSNPDNMRPVVFSSTGAAFNLTNTENVSLTLENVAMQCSGSGTMGVISQNTSGVTGKLASLTIRNCEFSTFYKSLIRKESGSIEVGDIIIDNSIFRWNAPKDGYGWIHISAQTDKLASVSISNSTFEGIWFLVNAQSNSSSSPKIDISIESCTFVNTASKASDYFIFANNANKGSVHMDKLLFAGSNSVTTPRMVRVNTGYKNLTYHDVYYTTSWYNFTPNLTDGTYHNFLTNESDADNDALFTDLANFDLSIKSGTEVHTKGIGDPRWIK